MNKSVRILGMAFFASTFLFGCSQDPTEISLSDLRTACEHLEAIEKCLDVMIEINADEVTNENQEHYKILNQKVRDIVRALEKKFTETEIEDCQNFETVKEKYQMR
jgi:hypothetical protein